MAKITTPVKGFTGTVAGVAFANGVGETDDAIALGYFERRGYGVEVEAPAETPEEEAARRAAEALAASDAAERQRLAEEAKAAAEAEERQRAADADAALKAKAEADAAKAAAKK